MNVRIRCTGFGGVTGAVVIVILAALALCLASAAAAPTSVAALPGCSTGDPAWSPDGEAIAFAGSSSTELPWEIRVVRPDGSGLRTLTTKPPDNPPFVTWTHDFEPTWAPDGRRLAFASGFAFWDVGYSHPLDGWGISVLDVATLTRTVIGEGRNPTWSRRGELAYSKFVDPYDDPGGIVAANTVLNGAYGDPTWSPSGRQVAFTAGGGRYVSVMNVDGTHRHRLARGRDPRWSPDGRWIAYFGTRGLDLISPDGRRHQHVLSGDEGQRFDPVWSPRGRRIVVGNAVVTLATRKVQHLDVPLTAYAGPSWSPDGQWLVFAAGRLVIVRPDGSAQPVLDTCPGSSSAGFWRRGKL